VSMNYVVWESSVVVIIIMNTITICK